MPPPIFRLANVFVPKSLIDVLPKPAVTVPETFTVRSPGTKTKSTIEPTERFASISALITPTLLGTSVASMVRVGKSKPMLAESASAAPGSVIVLVPAIVIVCVPPLEVELKPSKMRAWALMSLARATVRALAAAALTPTISIWAMAVPSLSQDPNGTLSKPGVAQLAASSQLPLAPVTAWNS